MKNINGNVTISRVDTRDGQYIEITIRDPNSVCAICAKMSIEDFGSAITGMGFQECVVEIPDDPSRLGKTRESIEIHALIPSGNKKDAEAAIIAATPEGWEPSFYLGSQSSYTYDNGGLTAHTRAYRWV